MIALLIPLIGAVPHIILGVEAIFHHGNGAAKKQAAMSVLGDLVNLITSSTGQSGANSDVMTYIDELIESTVKVMNATGVMTHAKQ